MLEGNLEIEEPVTAEGETDGVMELAETVPLEKILLETEPVLKIDVEEPLP